MNKKLVAAFAFACSVMIAADVEATTSEVEEKWVIQYEKPPNERDVHKLFGDVERTSNTSVTIEKQLPVSVVHALQKDSNVKFVERVQTRQAHQLDQSRDFWDYKSLGLPAFTAPATTEQPIVVAVLDSGVDKEHPYLEDAVLEGYNALDGSTNTADKDGHGTHVAGVIARAAEGYPVEILPVRVLDDNGIGESHEIAEGINWAVDNGADIINMSLGGYGDTSIERSAISYALENDVIVVASAGNEARDARFVYPASEPAVITVGAVDEKQQLAPFSNYGTVIDVVAPGDNIISTWPSSFDDSDEAADGYTSSSSTSIAASFVSGTLAVLKAAYPTLSNTTLEVLLKHHTVDLGTEGFDVEHGFGHVDVSDFVAEEPALVIETTEVNAAAPIIEIDVANGEVGQELVVIVGDERQSQPVVADEETYVFELTANAEPFEVTAQIKDASQIVATTTQMMAIQPKSYSFNVQNELGSAYSVYFDVSFYGRKDGAVEFLYAAVLDEFTGGYVIENEASYDEVYVKIEVDNARYVRKLGESEEVVATAENLVDVKLRNSYATTVDSYNDRHSLAPYVNGQLQPPLFYYFGREARTFIEDGQYSWQAVHNFDEGTGFLTHPSLVVDASVQLKNPVFDMSDYADVARVNIQSNVDENTDEIFSQMTIEDAAQNFEYVWDGEVIALSKGEYTFTYTIVESDSMEGEETYVETFSEKVTVAEDMTLTLEGRAALNTLDVKLSQQTTAIDLYHAPALPERQWKPMQLLAAHALHPWTIQLSEPVDETTLNKNVYVRNTVGFPVDVTLRVIDEGKTILVIPNQKYVTNGVYEVIVDSGLTSLSGDVLTTPVRATFTAK